MTEEDKRRCDTIRDTIPATTIAEMLGLTLDHSGRCACPFHNGQDKNMRIYPGNRGYYCFVCHAFGDCISLAKALLPSGFTYMDAAKWIDRTFHLNLFKPTFRNRQKMAEIRRRQYEAEQHEKQLARHT